MRCEYSCGTADHGASRRDFLRSVAGGVAGLGAAGLLGRHAAAGDLARNEKRVLVVNFHGGISQLETWDPKPGTETGGPFRAIPTSVPGLKICELLPLTAKQMHRLCVVRGVNTAEDDHGKGAYMMTTGRRQVAAETYPVIGATLSRAIAAADCAMPPHILITPGGGGGRNADSAYLGPRYASVALGNGNPPPHSVKPAQLPDADAADRDAFRRRIEARFASRRRTAFTDAYAGSFDQAQKLMERRDAFDVSKEPAKDMDRYGKHDLGRHLLLARRLLERGVPFVQVNHSNYDTHAENFDFHFEQVGEFDRPFAALVQDLADRGMLQSTLIVCLSEFGRTPGINHLYGRDHWSKAWSVLLGGCGVKAGAVHGKTGPKGTEVVEGQVDHANLFHTYLAALGLDSSGSFDVDGRKLPMADPSSAPIPEILA